MPSKSKSSPENTHGTAVKPVQHQKEATQINPRFQTSPQTKRDKGKNEISEEPPAIIAGRDAMIRAQRARAAERQAKKRRTTWKRTEEALWKGIDGVQMALLAVIYWCVPFLKPVWTWLGKAFEPLGPAFKPLEPAYSTTVIFFKAVYRIIFVRPSRRIEKAYLVVYLVLVLIGTWLCFEGVLSIFKPVAAQSDCSIVYVTVPGPIMTVSLIGPGPPTTTAQGTFYYSVVNGTTEWLNSQAPPTRMSSSVSQTTPIMVTPLPSQSIPVLSSLAPSGGVSTPTASNTSPLSTLTSLSSASAPAPVSSLSTASVSTGLPSSLPGPLSTGITMSLPGPPLSPSPSSSSSGTAGVPILSSSSSSPLTIPTDSTLPPLPSTLSSVTVSLPTVPSSSTLLATVPTDSLPPTPSSPLGISPSSMPIPSPTSSPIPTPSSPLPTPTSCFGGTDSAGQCQEATRVISIGTEEVTFEFPPLTLSFGPSASFWTGGYQPSTTSGYMTTLLSTTRQPAPTAPGMTSVFVTTIEDLTTLSVPSVSVPTESLSVSVPLVSSLPSGGLLSSLTGVLSAVPTLSAPTLSLPSVGLSSPSEALSVVPTLSVPSLGLPLLSEIPTLSVPSLGFSSLSGVPTLSVPSVGLPTVGVSSLNGVPTLSVPSVGLPTVGLSSLSGVPTLSVPSVGLPLLSEIPTLSVPSVGLPSLSGVPTSGLPISSLPVLSGVPTLSVPSVGLPLSGVPTSGLPLSSVPALSVSSVGLPSLSGLLTPSLPLSSVPAFSVPIPGITTIGGSSLNAPPLSVTPLSVPIPILPTLNLPGATGFSTMVAGISLTPAKRQSPPQDPYRCGEYGNFTLTWDDTPALPPINQTLQAPTVSNPWHHLFFANGYNYIPTGFLPFAPISPPNIAMYMPITGLLPNQPFAGTVLPGEIGAGPRASVDAYWFHAYAAHFGCIQLGITRCVLQVTGLQYNAALGQEMVAAQMNVTLPRCILLVNCHLTRVNFTPQFRNLSGIQFQMYSGGLGLPMIFIMDSLELAWYNDTCSAGILRIGHHWGPHPSS